MKRMKAIVILLTTICISLSVMAQNYSTQGTEFWVSFMWNAHENTSTNGPAYLSTNLLVSSNYDCSGTVTNPNQPDWSIDFTVTANNITLINIPREIAYAEQDEFTEPINKGIYVYTTAPVSLCCTNSARYSCDASFVLPIQALADDYIIQTWNPGEGTESATSAFLIVATEDETIVDITPSVNTLDGKIANETFEITLLKGQVYQVRSNCDFSFSGGVGRDLSGSRVTARDCKKIAVFSGNHAALVQIEISNNDTDCIFEQAMPLRTWGKNFVVTSSLDREEDDVVKITSAFDNNIIIKNGQPFDTLNTYESTTFNLPTHQKSCFIEASENCEVYLYTHSSVGGGNNPSFGAPNMVLINPAEQRIKEVDFSTFDDENPSHVNVNSHYVNIVIESTDVESVNFDGELIDAELFESVDNTDLYKFYRKQIEHGVHHLSCPNGFNAHVYGFGGAVGYAYMAGSAPTSFVPSIVVNDIIVSDGDTIVNCTLESIVFEADVNQQEYDILWDFGDGTTSVLNPATHIFQDPRIYQVSFVVNANTGDISCSDPIRFYVDATQHYIIENDETCAEEFYSGNGFNNVLIHGDTILCRLQESPFVSGCMDSLLVYITAHPQYNIPIRDSICWQGTSSVYDGYGFGFIYDHPGVYNQQLFMQSVYGCDSIINLHLTVDDQITFEFDHHECGSSFVWNGQSYSAPGIYEQSFVSIEGCDSVVTLHLTMGHLEYTSFDVLTCGTFQWNGQDYNESGTYQQQFNTIDGCDSIVTLHLVISDSFLVEADTAICSSLWWDGQEYSESGQYEQHYMTAAGCDSIVHLNLTVQPYPNAIPDIEGLSEVYIATNLIVGKYSYSIDSVLFATNYEWILEGANWPMETEGTKCTLWAITTGTATLTVRAWNDCGYTEQRILIHAGFYNVDEISNASFRIVPNPNNGQMILDFKHTTGDIEVKIHDMRGRLIDNIHIFNDMNSISYPYEMKLKDSGIYFFVATSREGIMAQKVIIVK